MIDINTVLVNNVSRIILERANAINDRGQILASVHWASYGQSGFHYYLLTPVPVSEVRVSQIGGGSEKLAATAAGDALIGSSVGQSMDDLDRMKVAQALETSRTGYSTNWKNPDSGAQYTMTPTRTYETAKGPCRDFTTQVDVNGRAETVYGTACRQPDGTWKSVLQAQPTGAAMVSPEAGNVVTIEQFQAWTHDNAYAAEQKLQAMGMINIRGRVDRVSAKDITLVGDTEIHPKIVCQFRQLPRSYGQPFSYATPPEASSLHRDALVTVAARFRKYLFPSKSTALFEDCRIVQLVPAAQAARAQTSAPQMGAVSQAPTGASQSSPPAGYYQCYRLTVAISANTCKLGDLQLDGQGNYSSARGPGVRMSSTRLLLWFRSMAVS